MDERQSVSGQAKGISGMNIIQEINEYIKELTQLSGDLYKKIQFQADGGEYRVFYYNRDGGVQEHIGELGDLLETLKRHCEYFENKRSENTIGDLNRLIDATDTSLPISIITPDGFRFPAQSITVSGDGLNIHIGLNASKFIKSDEQWKNYINSLAQQVQLWQSRFWESVRHWDKPPDDESNEAVLKLVDRDLAKE